MKNLSIKRTLSTVLIMFLFCHFGYSQIAAKKFDFSELENKVLYIPTYKTSSKFIDKMKKKGKYEKLASVNEKVELYNTAWEEAMAESSYEATDYEIRSFDRKTLIKSKNKKAVILYYYRDRYGNTTVNMMVTGPKKKVIASSYINGFDLSEKNDIRLMMNMLNDVLNTTADAQKESDNKSKANRKDTRSKYKERLVNFYDEMGDKTFLVPKSTHKKPKKATQRNADVKAALENWKLSQYEIRTEEEIEKKRLEGDSDYFYWRDIPVFGEVQGVPVTYHLNYILSADGDNIIMGFLGKKRLKPATLDKIQTKITKKATRYKAQLAK
jgi:hypothetical protein